MPYKLVKRYYWWWLDYKLQIMVNKARAELTMISKGVHVSSGCARHIPVYVYISVKGSRICKPCNVLAVRKYVRASMV